MAPPPLPAEIIEAIVQHVAAPRDLCALARTARGLKHPAEHVLYRVLWLSDARTLACLRTLAHSPHAARHVRHLTVSLDPRCPLLAPFYPLLAPALTNTSHLLSLSLVLGPGASASAVLDPPISPAAHSPSPRYPRLQSFSCNLALDASVAAFLSHTPALTQLQLSAAPDGPPAADQDTLVSVPPTVVPYLASFCGTSADAVVLAPGRPLTTVYLQAGELTEQSVQALARSSTPILMLCAYTSAAPLPLLQTIAAHLASLVYLRIEATNPLATQPDLAFHERVGKILMAIPNLSGFELSGIHFRPEFKVSPLTYTFTPASSSPPPSLVDIPRNAAQPGTKVWQSSRPSSPIHIYPDQDSAARYDFA